MDKRIDIYITMAENALEEKNYFECELYSNKILELNFKCNEAYVLKINLLTSRQRDGYCEKTTQISKQEWIDNLQSAKNMYYYMLISHCDFWNLDIHTVIRFIINDFFCKDSELADYELLVNNYTSVQLLIKIYEFFHLTDDRIMEELMNLYDEYGYGDLDKFYTYMSAFTFRRKYKLKSELIQNKYYDVMIKAKMRN